MRDSRIHTRRNDRVDPQPSVGLGLADVAAKSDPEEGSASVWKSGLPYASWRTYRGADRAGQRAGGLTVPSIPFRPGARCSGCASVPASAFALRESGTFSSRFGRCCPRRQSAHRTCGESSPECWSAVVSCHGRTVVNHRAADGTSVRWRAGGRRGERRHGGVARR